METGKTAFRPTSYNGKSLAELTRCTVGDEPKKLIVTRNTAGMRRDIADPCCGMVARYLARVDMPIPINAPVMFKIVISICCARSSGRRKRALSSSVKGKQMIHQVGKRMNRHKKYAEKGRQDASECTTANMGDM